MEAKTAMPNTRLFSINPACEAGTVSRLRICYKLSRLLDQSFQLVQLVAERPYLDLRDLRRPP